MPCYFIAQIEVHDPREYARYLEGTDAVLEQYSGRVLAVDESVVLLEGGWPFGRTVVIEFPDCERLERWYSSPEYRRILSHRKAASRSNAVAVRGRQ